MTAHDHENHGEPQPPQPQPPKPLLENPTVTIYLDGLIYTGYNQNSKLFEGAILTAAEEHHVVIEVRLRGDDKIIWPNERSKWDGGLETVKAGAPFWLYVDSGQGIQRRDFNAELNRDGSQSIVNILNFEKLHERHLPPKPETFAVFNFPHGTTYSAENTNAKLKTLPQGALPVQAEFLRDIDVSTLTAIDINAVSNGTGSKYIVLANQDGNNEFFRFELEAGKHYEIQILNQPVDPHSGHDPREHFLQFYELFVLNPEEKMFLVEPPIASQAVHPQPPPTPGGTPGAAPPNPPHSPPCVTTIGDTEGGLRG